MIDVDVHERESSSANTERKDNVKPYLWTSDFWEMQCASDFLPDTFLTLIKSIITSIARDIKLYIVKLLILLQNL